MTQIDLGIASIWNKPVVMVLRLHQMFLCYDRYTELYLLTLGHYPEAKLKLTVLPRPLATKWQVVLTTGVQYQVLLRISSAVIALLPLPLYPSILVPRPLPLQNYQPHLPQTWVGRDGLWSHA